MTNDKKKKGREEKGEGKRGVNLNKQKPTIDRGFFSILCVNLVL